MTTATDEATAKVDLAASNGTKRRGRPPGSKNKPKESSTTTRTRRARAAAPVKAATPTRAASAGATAVLVTNDGIEVLHADGSTQMIHVAITGAPLFDRRK